MITSMKKVTLLSLESARESTLAQLKGLGVLHLLPLRNPSGEDLETARRNVARIQSAKDFLPLKTAKKRKQPVEENDNPIAQELVKELHLLNQKRQALSERIQDLELEINRLRPFGRIDPQLMSKLEVAGIKVSLLRAPKKNFAQMMQDLSSGAPHAVLREFGEHLGFKYLAVLSQEPIDMPSGWEIVRPPEVDTKELQLQLEKTQQESRQLEEKLEVLAQHRGLLSSFQEEANEILKIEDARAGMIEQSGLCAIRGYCPEPLLEKLRETARNHSWGLLVEDPTETDRVPTLLRQAPWVKPINTLFGLIGILPGYREIDISSVFLLFFTLFFGMLVGDAGYGLLFLGITLWARRKFPQAPLQVFVFLGIMSVMTIVWGILTATWFGITPESLPALLNQAQIAWLSDAHNLQYLCFLIGSIHLTIAHAWNLWLMRRSLQALSQLGWLATTWTMFFLANQLVLGKDFPDWMWKVFAGGVLLVFLFNIPVRKLKSEWFNLVMLPLNLVSNFVDVVSYIRLFAVGSATFAVANNFNQMLSPLFDNWATAAIGALLLFLGHALNVSLAVMGVLVHGVRLNTLEFSNHIGLQWTGEAYRPLADKTNSSNP